MSKKIPVLFLVDVLPHGRKGEIQTVSAGFAKNFLFPNNSAIPATTKVKATAERAGHERSEQQTREASQHEMLRKKLSAVSLRIHARANERGILFGSLGAREICAALAAQGFCDIPASSVQIEKNFTTIGKETVEIRVGDAMVSIPITIVPREESKVRKRPTSHAEQEGRGRTSTG
ncbi:MAG: 50S ribosomal protein L9 [bacterium]